MRCPKCQDEHPFVINSRHKTYGLRRRRECLVCGYRYSTVEIDVDQYKLMKHTLDEVCLIAKSYSVISVEEDEDE
jgi:transcriptional repressor NrdR